MCGIAGVWATRSEDTTQTVTEMIRLIQHRGPDGQGILAADETRQCVFGHARLAIVDLSPAGQQPMASASGRYVLAFNGEIYNHLELRAKLEAAGVAPAWRGHSDTESLLAAIEAWGLERAVIECVGMFAIALWDKADRNLTLVRDRFGEKPLYWAVTRRGIVFASELKALLGSGMLDHTRLSADAAAELLRFNKHPGPAHGDRRRLQARSRPHDAVRHAHVHARVAPLLARRRCLARRQGQAVPGLHRGRHRRGRAPAQALHSAAR